jgi:hypothetical protein
MAQVARAHTEAAGGPDKLKSLAVEFRQPGMIGEEIHVTGTVERVEDGVAIVTSEADQGGKRIVRNGRAEVKLA